MLRFVVRLVVLSTLAVLAVAPLTAAAAGGGGGGSNGMTVTVGAPITLQGKLLVTVPVTVSCVAPLTAGFPGGVAVVIQQANGKQIAHGNGGAELDSCSPTPQTFLLQVVPDIQPASAPFKKGGAIVQASGGLCDNNYPQTCYFGTTDWVPIRIG